MGASGGPNIVEDGLVFSADAENKQVYISGSASPDIIIDSIGGAQGTVDNTITYNPANGGYWTFDGSDSDIALGQGGSGGKWSTNPCTYEFVVTFNGTCVLWMDRAAYNGTEGVELWVEGGDGSTKIRARGSSGTLIETGADYDHGTWYHLIYRFDGTTGTIFVNGESKVSGTVDTVANTTYNTSWGKYASTNTYEWDGNIALGRIYHKALTQAEVTQNYNAQKSRFGL